MNSLLSISLTVAFGKNDPVLKDFCLEMRKGEILGLLGGSGSGKSTLSLAILGLLGRETAVSGRVQFNGRDLIALPEGKMREVRGREIGLVLQSPSSALNPMLRIGTQLHEAWRAHEPNKHGEMKIAQALERVSLPSDKSFLKRYPSEISVGQGQRVLVAMAMLHSPTLVIADEPTSALDAITQIQILELFKDINRDCGASILFISHDLASVRTICDRVAIIYEGKVVACDSWNAIVEVSHPYVKALTSLGAQPTMTKTAVAGSL
jgi:peptide/nickel transport system ATP-binding protein